MHPKLAEYITASQASMDKAAAELAQNQSQITALAAEKRAGADLIPQVVDALASGNRIPDSAVSRKKAAEQLSTYAGAMQLLKAAATYAPPTQAAPTLGTPVPSAQPAGANGHRNSMSPNPQAGLDKLARAIGAPVS